MPHSTQLRKERTATGTPASSPRVRVARKHHLLVRISHWLNIPLLLGLIVSGISIYWASPVYRHNPDPQTGSSDYLADAGIWICAHLPGGHDCASRPDWIYNHISLGPAMLAPALRLHWCCAIILSRPVASDTPGERGAAQGLCARLDPSFENSLRLSFRTALLRRVPESIGLLPLILMKLMLPTLRTSRLALAPLGECSVR